MAPTNDDAPLLIPIIQDTEIPEYAMIEVNGELLPPKEDNTSDSISLHDHDNILQLPKHFELGALHLVNQVRHVQMNCSLLFSSPF